MKPKGLVFFDLDGTLLNATSELDKEISEALESMKQNGIIPFVATGRSPLEIQHVLENSPIDSFITLNGQYIVYEGKEVYRSVIPQPLMKELKEAADEHDFPLSMYTHNKIRTTKDSETMVTAYKNIHTTPPKVDEDFHLNEEVLMALIINNDAGYDNHFRERFPELSFYRNTPYSVDTIIKNNSKATGIRELEKLLGLENVPTYAFGDGPNDKEMIQYADYGIAMQNGVGEVKEVADYVTSASNVDGGIIEGLKKFQLI
ncbi:Cof-type HAD-IIB family hydrolase [Desemzia incerta]|uniref:Cof-type HAD-IIB family hydrolase n=1 Tax=Desemzia incerta TaxID=82801 RepID=UPI00166133CC|nr:Cof-type HAD-IIB family hydrolase [Desemzia incerta]